MTAFELHPNLAKKNFLLDFPLCRILWEDEKHYLWLLLVPRQSDKSRLIDLSLTDQLQLMKELNVVQKVVWQNFHPTQLNVAAIGNKTPQLHVHVIARYYHDPAWPGTVWDHPTRSPHPLEQKEEMIQRLKNLLDFKKLDDVHDFNLRSDV